MLKLAEKPKLFIFQACCACGSCAVREDLMILEGGGSPSRQDVWLISIPLVADCLVAFLMAENFVAYRSDVTAMMKTLKKRTWLLLLQRYLITNIMLRGSHWNLSYFCTCCWVELVPEAKCHQNVLITSYGGTVSSLVLKILTYWF